MEKWSKPVVGSACVCSNNTKRHSGAACINAVINPAFLTRRNFSFLSERSLNGCTRLRSWFSYIKSTLISHQPRVSYLSYLAVEIAAYLAINGGSGRTRMGSFVQIHHVDDQWGGIYTWMGWCSSTGGDGILDSHINKIAWVNWKLLPAGQVR